MSLDTEILSTAFRFCCALESSCMGRLSAIKVQLEFALQMWQHEVFVLHRARVYIGTGPQHLPFVRDECL